MAQQRGDDLLGEGQRLEHLLHAGVQQRVGDREQPDGEQPVALLLGRARGRAARTCAPRSSASATSWSGASATEDSATTVAQRRTARDAEQRERLAHGVDLARQREEGRVDVAQQRDREADVGADDPLEVLEGGLARPSARAAPAARPRRRRRSSPRGRAKNSPWKCEKPSTRQRVNSSASATPVATSTRPRSAGPAISARSSSSVAPADADLDDPAVLEQLGAALEVVEREREARRRQLAAPARSRRRERAAGRRARGRAPAASAPSSADPHRAARAELEQLGGREAVQHAPSPISS